MINHKILKKLARSNKFQIIYNRVKEMGSLKLFKNSMDLSSIQLWFLYYLELYGILYSDLAMGEDLINEEVIEDDIRMEAYLLYKRERRKQKSKELVDDKKKTTPSDIPTVIFNTKRK